MTIDKMKARLDSCLGLVWYDQFYEYQNKGYSMDGAIIMCYNSYF